MVTFEKGDDHDNDDDYDGSHNNDNKKNCTPAIRPYTQRTYIYIFIYLYMYILYVRRNL